MDYVSYFALVQLDVFFQQVTTSYSYYLQGCSLTIWPFLPIWFSSSPWKECGQRAHYTSANHLVRSV